MLMKTTFKVSAIELGFSLPLVKTESKTDRLIAEMRKAAVPLPDPEHFFGDKVYVRKLTVGAGMAIAGAKHKRDHVFAVISGWMYVYDDAGVRKVNAGDVFESKAGTQRVAWAPDVACACIAIHGTEKTDLAALEADLVEMENSMEVLQCPGE